MKNSARHGILLLAVFTIGLTAVWFGAQYFRSREHCDDNSVRILNLSLTPLESRLYAMSGRILEASVKLEIDGKNTRLIPSNPGYRALSAGLQDPYAQVVAIDDSQPMRFDAVARWHLGVPSKRTRQDTAYALPVLENTECRISAGFNEGSHIHERDFYSVDFLMPEGSIVCAARDGVVIAVRDDSDSRGSSEDYERSANYIVVKHDDGSYAEYVHLQKDGVLAKLGSKVSVHDCIALSGMTGKTTGPHLHFSVFHFDERHERHSLQITFDTNDGLLTTPKGGMRAKKNSVDWPPGSLSPSKSKRPDKWINARKRVRPIKAILRRWQPRKTQAGWGSSPSRLFKG